MELFSLLNGKLWKLLMIIRLSKTMISRRFLKVWMYIEPNVALISVALDELVNCNTLFQNNNALLKFYLLLILSLQFSEQSNTVTVITQMQVAMPAITRSFIQVLENMISLSRGINRFGSRYLYLCLHSSPWRQRVLYSHPWTNFMFLRLPLVKCYLYSVFQPVSWKLKVYWTFILLNVLISPW